MKIFFTLIVTFFAFTNKINAQSVSNLINAVPAVCASSTDSAMTSETPAKVVIGHYDSPAVDVQPLFVIDGIMYEYNEISKLNPDNIVSIDILKRSASGAMFGCRPARDVILITTKELYLKEFTIKDFLTGEKIPFATVYLTSGNDTINAVADEKGVLIIDKFKAGNQYGITVSSAGYKTLSTVVSGKVQEILLERDVKENDNVVVTAYSVKRRGCCCCGICTKNVFTKANELKSAETSSIKSLYPNPVQRNNIFNLELENEQDEQAQLSIISLNGSVVFFQLQKINKGSNRLSIIADAKWAAGIYIVQLRNEKGSFIKQEKLVVQ